MRRAVRRSLVNAGAAAGDNVVVAVSGGSDSMALAVAAQYVAAKEGMILRAITVDHGWREESRREAENVREALRGLGIECVIEAVDSTPCGEGLEAAARAARYAALAASARASHAVLLVGHTADDQAETVLLGIARGSGSRSLAGMPPMGPCPGASDVTMLRPFLSLRREQLREALRSEHIGWFEDPTNAPDSPVRAAHGGLLTRAALRHHALPALEEALGPGVVESLARSARLLRDDGEALDSAAIATGIGADGVATCAELLAQPRALRTRILRRMALMAGARPGELTAWHIETLDALVANPRGERWLNLPGTTARIHHGQIGFKSAVHGNEKESNGRQ